MLILERNFHACLCACLEGFELNVFDSILLVECHLRDSGTTAQRDLAATQFASAAKVSMRLEVLRKQGILESWRPVDDRRRQYWRVTVRGLELIQELNQRISSSFGSSLIDRVRTLAEAVSQTLVDPGLIQPDSQHNQPRVA